MADLVAGSRGAARAPCCSARSSPSWSTGSSPGPQLGRQPGARADSGQPAWTVRGRPLPAVSPSEFGQPNPSGNAEAVIAVERIRGPILLACGEQDLIWPSCGYGDAGHLIGGLAAWYGPLTDDPLTSFGGTVAGAHAKLRGPRRGGAHAHLCDR